LPVKPVGNKEVRDDIWVVTFMEHDLGQFDLEQKTLQPAGNDSFQNDESP
jgi:hypothetical protein